MAGRPKRPNILVVDDTDDTRESLALMLRMRGYDVTEACDGAEALDLLQNGCRPTAIVLDLAMPVLDGRGFLQARATDAALARIPVIVYSGYPPDLKEHITAFVEKGRDPDVALALVDTVVRRVG